MTLSSRHRIRNSSPGGLRPSTLPLGHGGSPQYWLSHVDGEETFCFFQTAETGNRTPKYGVKGSGANHYPRAPALPELRMRVKKKSTPFMPSCVSSLVWKEVQCSLVALEIVHRPGENRRTGGHVHVDSLALIHFSRIKLVNIKKINQSMVINLTCTHT